MPTTLGELHKHVREISLDHHDSIVSADDVHFANLEQVIINGQLHPILPHAQRLISNRLGVPHQYLQRCPPSLQAKNLNHWITEQKEDREFLVRFDGDHVRAVFTPRYKKLDNIEVLDRLNELGFAPETEVHVQFDSNFMSLSIPDEGRTFSIQPGDRVTPGISIANSEVGLSSLKIEAYCLRLVCTNGLISKMQTASSFRHISKKILEELPLVLRTVSEGGTMVADHLRFSLSSRVDNPDSTFNSFNRQFQLEPAEIEAVAWGWQAEPVNTMFGIIQAYTKGAQHHRLDAHSQYRLQRAGGDILAMVRH
ncbi:MAG: DUF945 domain-containing protein [Magnetococcus sp. YQC-3]|nr:DUF932 domain-containing protein [Magnetococcales bacterium]